MNYVLYQTLDPLLVASLQKHRLVNAKTAMSPRSHIFHGPDGQGGLGDGTALPAPQGSALMGVINAVRSGNVPADKYVMGGTIGALLGTAPVPGFGVLIGLAMYLPFSITLGFGIGCFVQMTLRHFKVVAICEHKLVPFAAGLIVGEALTGVGHALCVILISTLRGRLILGDFANLAVFMLWRPQ